MSISLILGFKLNFSFCTNWNDLCKSSHINFNLFVINVYFCSNLHAILKHPWCKGSEAKSEAPVTSIFCMRLKSVISGRGQAF